MARSPDQIVGVSPEAAAIRLFVSEAARGCQPVTLTGEPGTGKQLAARLIHEGSERRQAPFLMIDCSLFYEAELRRELFGSAVNGDGGAERKGLLEFAGRGTCYLSRVEELSSSLQCELLAYLEEECCPRPGAGKEPGSRARLIVSSDKNLAGFVDAGLFNARLHARLSPFTLRLAPLRERREDIPAVVSALVAVHAVEHSVLGPVAFSQEAQEALKAYPWPANLRELKREVLRVLARGLERVGPEDLSLEVASYWFGGREDPALRKVIEELDASIREFRILSRLSPPLANLMGFGTQLLVAGTRSDDLLEEP
jgi:DNA-binding NtrC family response regulator